MFIPDEEKSGRKEALQKLMDLMGSETGKRLGGLKKPMASIEIDSEPDDDMGFQSDDDDQIGMDDNGGDEPSEEDKAKISELYHKYC